MELFNDWKQNTRDAGKWGRGKTGGAMQSKEQEEGHAEEAGHLRKRDQQHRPVIC